MSFQVWIFPTFPGAHAGKQFGISGNEYKYNVLEDMVYKLRDFRDSNMDTLLTTPMAARQVENILRNYWLLYSRLA
jgi:hypothetical protein